MIDEVPVNEIGRLLVSMTLLLVVLAAASWSSPRELALNDAGAGPLSS